MFNSNIVLFTGYYVSNGNFIIQNLKLYIFLIMIFDFYIFSPPLHISHWACMSQLIPDFKSNKTVWNYRHEIILLFCCMNVSPLLVFNIHVYTLKGNGVIAKTSQTGYNLFSLYNTEEI